MYDALPSFRNAAPTTMTAPSMEEPRAETPADIETASAGYASRFQGPVGTWMLERQEEGTLALLRDLQPKSVLEVGGGHGQLTGGLIRAGYQVTVQGSAEVCRERIASHVASGRCAFVVGSFLDLPFPDRSFDAVVSVRLIMHSAAWPRLIGEMCRVAKRAVVVDYPLAGGLNALAPLLFGAKKQLEKNTRTWRNFSHAEVAGVFAEHGFSPAERRGQFVFPMVIHRTLQHRRLSAAMEGFAAGLGLHRCVGSPVLARFDRRVA
jgi:SAM-dependent methyltransferase